ncbi:hypothetical protein P22_0943 [Propionispora sp. 2/2-37]|uniref:PucR family transcriptional regulator n=1 Tax=Propionispora sp. 2/2-37 TaxID=1677858 RepID=UPI0006BB6195|nr:PucR family transcriptional regulator [Propionispora sp. 2/2-37]CUH94877.1 hypothetical protein P22_0943 [Propionispora sp. 2/2-37]
MTVLCRDILKIESFKRAELIGGKAGLGRVVRWIHVSDVPDIANWVQSGDIVATTGVNSVPDSDYWTTLIRELSSKRLAALIINIGPYIDRVPEGVKETADELAFPVFSLPWEVKLADVTRDLSRLLAKDQWVEETVQDVDLFLRKVHKNNKVLQIRSFHMVKFKVVSGLVNMVASEDRADDSYGRVYLRRLICDQVVQHQPYIARLLMIDQAEIAVIFTNIKSNQVKFLTESIIAKAGANGLALQAGISSGYVDVDYLRISYEQALWALQCVNVFKDKTVYEFKKLGLLKLLFNTHDVQKLENFYHETLDQLVEYDKNFETSLLESVWIFLKENGNGIKAAERLFIHRNTLRYRIQRAAEILGVNFDHVEERMTIQAAMVIGKILNL